MNNTPIYTHNKIGHSSRSSSVQRSKTTADQRCLVITISENLAIHIEILQAGEDAGKTTADQRCLVITILKNLAFHLLKKRWVKDRQTAKQKEKRKTDKK